MTTITKISGTPDQLLHRRELVDALRSGKYKQARGALNTPEGMCCLGLGCEISGLGSWGEFVHTEDGTKAKFFLEGSYHGERHYLPLPVSDWLGIEAHGDYSSAFSEEDINEGFHGTLADDNDKGKSFAEIADEIELYWEVAPATTTKETTNV